MLARVLAVVVVSVCVSFCLSHAGTVSKQLNIGSGKQWHVIAQGLYIFLTPTVVGERPHSPWNLHSKRPTPFQKQQFRQYSLIVPQLWKLAKNVQLALIESRPSTFQQAKDEPYMLPVSPAKGGTNAILLWPTPVVNADFDRFCLIVPQPRQLAQKVQLLLIGGRQCVFHRAIDKLRASMCYP